jgi:hypothetical protein
MIYLQNNKNIVQRIFIPREAVNGKEMIEVVKGYEEGVADGILQGVKSQKDKLQNIYITDNGEYHREDGFGTITVDVQHTISLENKDLTVSTNGEYEIVPSDGFDGLERVNLTVDVPQEGGGCNLVSATLSFPTGENYKTYNASEYGYDGFENLEINAIRHNEWKECKTIIDFRKSGGLMDLEMEADDSFGYEFPEHGTYYGPALYANRFFWYFLDIIPTIDTDIEMWVFMTDSVSDVSRGIMGCQNSENDPNSTFSIRQKENEFCFIFQFGEAYFEFYYDIYVWTNLRMNRNGVWVNGYQVCEWNVTNFTGCDCGIAINEIFYPNYSLDSLNTNQAMYGYIYFHNTDVLYVPLSTGFFTGNDNGIVQYGINGYYELSYEMIKNPIGIKNLFVNIPQCGDGGDCDCQEIDMLLEQLIGHYEEPEPEPEPDPEEPEIPETEITLLNIVDGSRTYSGQDEIEVTFYDEEYNQITIEFLSNPIEYGRQYTLQDGLSGLYCKYKSVHMTECNAIVEEQEDVYHFMVEFSVEIDGILNRYYFEHNINKDELYN